MNVRQSTADTLARENAHYDVVVGFNYLHLAGILPVVLGDIRSMLAPGGLFISKTPCLGDMHPLVRLAIPVLRFFGKAPSVVTACSSASLLQEITKAGFEILDHERHGTKKSDHCPFIVARAL